MHLGVTYLRGLPYFKKNLLLLTWEKNVLNKTYVSWGSKQFVSRLFLSKNVKKMICIENTGYLGGPVENASSPTISQIEQNWWFYFIYKG